MLSNQSGMDSKRHRVVTVLFASLLSLNGIEPAKAAISASGNNSPNPTTSGASPIIGISDVGRLTINGGSMLSSNVVTIGDLVNGVGLVTVTDFNSGTGSASTWTTGSLYVGDAGTGRLDVLNGAIVTVDYAGNPGAGDLTIGNVVGGIGTVIVNGLGSILRVGDDTNVGTIGTGTLRIQNEGIVVATNDAVTDQDVFTVGALGRLELAGGRLRAQALTNNGVIIGSGRIDNGGTIANSTTGHIETGLGDRLVVNAVVDNDGEIAVHGGEMEFLKAVTNSSAAAEITLRDGGVVRFPKTAFGFDTTTGVLATTAGTNDIYGTVRIQGTGSKIVVAGGSTAVFHDLVTNAGGVIEVFPGSTPIYLQGLTTTGIGSVLSIHLADPEVVPDFGQVEVGGSAVLDGSLAIQLAGGFVPAAGDVFQVLAAAGGITGSLSLASAPALTPGLQWDLDVNPTTVIVSVVSTGDYNGNGVVDAADYLVWRNTLGQTGRSLAADGNGNAMVDVADYDFWRSRFGNVIVGSGAGVAAVPEPASVFLLLCVGALAPRTRGCGAKPQAM